MTARRKKLKWGETPWDKLPHDELLREAQRMASALVAARGALRQAEFGQESSSYWSVIGTGGRALAKVTHALRRYDEVGDEACYRAFFRYANDLLFSPELGSDWRFCESCGSMWGAIGDQPSRATCSMPKCKGAPLRRLVWGDLMPVQPR